MGKNRYKKIHDNTYKAYRDINSVICPVLNNENIYFDDRGFRHLIFKGKKRRSFLDQIRRFKLIKYAPEIIKNSLEHEYTKGQSSQFWSMQQEIGSLEIKIVIRQVGTGRKHFFSIMSKQCKSPSKGASATSTTSSNAD